MLLYILSGPFQIERLIVSQSGSRTVYCNLASASSAAYRLLENDSTKIPVRRRSRAWRDGVVRPDDGAHGVYAGGLGCDEGGNSILIRYDETYMVCQSALCRAA
jgi:hypothetical protein